MKSAQKLLYDLIEILHVNRKYMNFQLVNVTVSGKDSPCLPRGYGPTLEANTRINLLFKEVPTTHSCYILTTGNGNVYRRTSKVWDVKTPAMYYGFSFVYGPAIKAFVNPVLHTAPCDSKGRVLENIFPNTGVNYLFYDKTARSIENLKRLSVVCGAGGWTDRNYCKIFLHDDGAQDNDADKLLTSLLEGVNAFWSTSFAYDSDFISPAVYKFVQDHTNYDLKHAPPRYSSHPGKYAKLLELAARHDLPWDEFPRSNPRKDLFVADYISPYKQTVQRRDALKRRVDNTLETITKITTGYPIARTTER